MNEWRKKNFKNKNKICDSGDDINTSAIKFRKSESCAALLELDPLQGAATSKLCKAPQQFLSN